MSHYHFIGIGGVSMSGIAMILNARGHEITGSDRSLSAATDPLTQAGIKISCPQKAENITDDIDTVVYTAAIHEDNPELIAARDLEKRLGKRVIERSVMLGELLSEHKIPVGVAGTHGKTSTSSILSLIHLEAGVDPTIQIGGIMNLTGTNYRIGHGDHMVIEACEYSDSFLEFKTRYAIVTNIEAEHLDYFGTFENMQASFRKYADLMTGDGSLITSPECAALFGGISSKVVTVSLEGEADCTCRDIVPHEGALGSSFTLIYRGKEMGRIDIYVPGRHLVYDAMCAACCALEEGLPMDAVIRGIAAYRPTRRRFEMRGMLNGAMVVDDYAHHPSEIKATMLAAKEVPHKELTVVFQPHTYSRTISFYNDFVEALSLADHVIMADIYAAREIDTGEVSSLMLANSLKDRGIDARHFGSFDEIEKYLKKNISTGDLLITMGAGDVVNIANHLTNSN